MHKHSYKLYRIYGYPGFGLVLYLILILINPYERTTNSWRLYAIRDFVFELTLSVVYAAALFETGIQLTALLNKWYSWERGIKSRFGIQLFMQMAIIYVMVDLFFKFRFPAYFGYDDLMFRQVIIMGLIFSLLITAVFTAEYFFYRWNDARIKSMEMEQLTTQAQLEALKLQLDPHFLFNNLSIVTALVEDQPGIAISYITKLSSIYRYMLSNRTKNTILLMDELEFIKAYLFLYEIRYGEGIKVDIEENQSVLQLALPPLTLQLLIENAIKHNVFSNEEPLNIHIYFPEGKVMVVENNVMIKTDPELSTNMGLKNISERYRLMGLQLPVVTNNEHVFRVEIPLIRFNN
jgi:signal transduction histidine kinase